MYRFTCGCGRGGDEVLVLVVHTMFADVYNISEHDANDTLNVCIYVLNGLVLYQVPMIS